MGGWGQRTLERYKGSFAEDGKLLIDKNVKFQSEKGQWTGPGAFLDFVG